MSQAERGLFAVCDGMGGAAAGEVASRLAIDTITGKLAVEEPAGIASGRESGYLPRTSRLATAVRRSNHVIYHQAQNNPDQAGMGTTVVAAWVAQPIASVAHVGDSRAYLWSRNELVPLTRDHSLAEAHISTGLLDRAASLDCKDQHVLVRVLGRERDVDVELNEVPVQPGDYLLLCSDGLTRMVPEETLAETISRLRHPQQICDHLVDVANNNGGTDNITVVVVEVVDSWWRHLSRRLRRPKNGTGQGGHDG